MTAETVTQPAVRTLPGQLGPGRIRGSMPVDAPYYQEPPFYFRDARAMTIAYETDAGAAAALLPEGLELPLPAMARLMLVRYPFSTFGPYNEAILGLECLWQGAPRFYIAHIAVTEIPPLVAGREVWGYPKKMAHIEIEQEAEFLRGTLERPRGVRLITAAMRMERSLPLPSGDGGGGSLSLRVIPAAGEGAPPALAELIEVSNMESVTHEAWAGTGTLSFDTASALDPWHCLPVGRITGAVYTRYDFTLPHGRVLKRYC